MNRPAPEILVCADGTSVCIRIRGRADVTISVGFKELLTGLHERGFQHYELELSECQVMDSTFLGVLCGFAQRREAGSDGRYEKPILLNANERITGLLTSLGVSEMFVFRTGRPSDEGPCAAVPPGPGRPSREDLDSTSLEAHQTLMALNPDNIPRFKDLTEFLAEDLKKLRSSQ
ncbi:MAG: STAS domain-containing protein [Verrucomicrobia bacterium]|jgi:anti-anti-sigma regulatory factor|nr:STAS domain-containing protein [Verrucomicrobiota bacterium]